MQKRWNVKLTHESPDERDVHTFTWAYTYEYAVERMQKSMSDDPEVWEGWTYIVTEDVEYSNN